MPAACAVFLLTVVFHLPHLNEPFGSHEQNSGCYFGVFARSFADHGALTLRGVSVYKTRFQPLSEAILYQSHPPGVGWIASIFGVEEWCIRLPFVIAGALCGALLCLLLAGTVGSLRAALAGLLFALSAGVAFDGVVSQETMVGAAGLSLLLAFRRANDDDAKRRHRLAVVGVAFAGVWLDWTFAWWLLALIPLAPRKNAAIFVRALAGPALASIVSLALLFLWRHWAMQAPAFVGRAVTGGVDAFAAAVTDRRPSWQDFAAGACARIGESMPGAVLVCGGLGLWRWFRVGRGLAAALLAPVVLNALVFSHHFATHVQFVSWIGLTVAAAVAAGAEALRRPMLRRVGLLMMVLIVGWTAFDARSVWGGRSGTYFRDLGAFFDREAAEIPPGRPPRRIWYTVCNLPYAYAAYINTPYVAAGVVTDEALRTLIACLPPGVGLKFIAVTVDLEPAEGPAAQFQLDAELEARLALSPFREAPELRGRVPTDRYGKVAAVARSARVYEVVAAQVLPESR